MVVSLTVATAPGQSEVNGKQDGGWDEFIADPRVLNKT
jgi:hypothetical protein